MIYEQTLWKEIKDIVNPKILAKNNRFKKWEYGYNSDYDFIVISKTGQIGQIIEIQNLRIALPAANEPFKRSKNKAEQYWQKFEYPKELQRIKTRFDWEEHSVTFKEKWYDCTIILTMNLLDEKKDFGFIIMVLLLTLLALITCTCSGQRSTSELQTIESQIGCSSYFGKRVKQMTDVTECAILKIDDLDSLLCQAQNLSIRLQYLPMLGLEYFPSLEQMPKKCLQIKLCPYQLTTRSFLNPWPKTELAYRVPASKLTRRKLESNEQLRELDGLDTTIDWKNTGDNSYDGEKLKILAHDESGKWERPDNILNNWRVTKTTLRLGSRIVGKCMMGSTSNALDKGGDNFKKLYYNSDVNQRNKNGQTASGLYSLFIPMEWNYEGFMDTFGSPIFVAGSNPVKSIDGSTITTGVIQHWENEVEGLKHDQDALNEYYRQFPRTEKHAFRDETKQSLFNLTKIYQQIDFNEEINNDSSITKGNFIWENGIKDTKVLFMPNNKGRFLVSWIPDFNMQNNIIIKNGIKYPANEHIGAFGCDSYDISGTVDGRGSKGALHGLTKFSMENAPINKFFLEYISRPQTAEIFFEDVLMALHFYGMPILAENNKPRLLYYLKRRGYRGFSMNRPDKLYNKLSVTEREIGGIPNSSEDIKQAHAAAIEHYIENFIGQIETGYGDMYFQKTLDDWAKFNINDRTKYDASISSGLAIMACNKNRYRPVPVRNIKPVNLGISTYNNKGSISQIIK
jgi:hypothetical protein